MLVLFWIKNYNMIMVKKQIDGACPYQQGEE
nr:MAG TPA: hypothetical protein [Caudoviricetes sp.]